MKDDRRQTQTIIAITGPTASGKSQLALALAAQAQRQDCPAVIINADALQVYAELPLLTGQPSLTEQARVPHALYAHVPLPTAYSVGLWLKAVHATIAAANPNATLFVVGGTGLYIQALLEGLPQIPAIPEAVLAQAKADVDANPQACRALLARVTPEPEAIPRDRQRLIRAVSVYKATQRPLHEWQKRPHWGSVSVDSVIHVIPSKEQTAAAITARVNAQFAAGVMDEVSQLVANHPWLRAHAKTRPCVHPILGVLGLQHFLCLLDAELSAVEVRTALVRDSRRYAKRQRTWLRHHHKPHCLIDTCVTQENAQENASAVCAHIAELQRHS